jgi:Tol biopolymer transport system component
MSSSVGFPCVTKSSTLYFGAVAGQGGKNAVYRSKLENNAYRSIEKLDLLPPASEYITGDFYVSPDESYIIFYSNLLDNLGQGDLYVAFQKPGGTWTKPKNLGKAVNTPGYDFAPSISPDGKYLFFTRDVVGGQGDIYWISAKIVDSLR